MALTHRLHRVHTGRTESDAVAVASEKVCSSCLEPLSQLEKPAFHCNQCDYTVCGACDKPKSHPVHPNHGVFYITPIWPWWCDVCKLSSENIEEIQCYHCKQCDFHICKKCYAGVSSPLHVHGLYRTDVSYVYQSNGEWICRVCGNNNGPGHFFPAHCSSCQFDLCDNCIKPHRSTFHPAHILYEADSNLVYPRYDGGWRCGKCSLTFTARMNNVPFHCSQCDFNLCDNCMKITVDVPNADKDEEIRGLEAREKAKAKRKASEERRRRMEAGLADFSRSFRILGPTEGLEIAREEAESTRAYFQALQESKAKNNRIPIKLVGQCRGGKTSLMKRLLGLPFNKDQPSTTGIDVIVIELTEQNAEDPWKKTELQKFMTSESEAKTILLKKTAECFDSGVQRNLEGDAPEPVIEAKTVLFRKTAECFDYGVQRNLEGDAPEPGMPLKPVVPAELLREEISKIKSQSSTEHDQKDVLRVFVSDFAGQSIYYDTHGCFVKSHCPYVLVHDLSLDFDKPAVPRFKASNEEEEIEMNNPYLNTNLDHFTSWLKLLQDLGDKSGHCTTAKGEKFKRPPVLIALTHSDKVKGNDSKILSVKERIKNVVAASDYENVIPGVFVIDNTLEGDDGDDVRKLRRELFDYSNAVLNHEILMPLKWLNFEVALSRKLSPDCRYIPVDKAKQEAQACGVVEFDQAIKFLHRQGVVVHNSGSSKVVLDPHWLMNRFTKVIAMPGKLDALSRHALDVFKQKGILFRKYLQTLEDADLLEELMQKFNLICPCQHEGKEAFYVPSVVPAIEPGQELEASNVPSLFVTFPRKLVPMSLFTKLQVKLISEWGKRFPNQQVKPSFYCNYSSFPLIIDSDVYDVRLIDLHEFIKVAVFPKQDGNHFTFASHFLATLEKCLDDLKSPDQLLFSMTSYVLGVKCTCCFGKEEICSRHHESQCHSDRCGHRHFWKLSDLQRFYNDKSPAVCGLDKRSSMVFDIKSVKIWLNTVPEVVEDSSNLGNQNETSSEASSSVPDVVEDSSNLGNQNETLGEASSSGLQTTGDSHRRSMDANYVKRMGKCLESVCMISVKNKDDDGLTYTGSGWLVAKEESESYIMTNFHVFSDIMERSRQTQREIKVVIQFDYLSWAQPSCIEFEVPQQAEISDKNLDYAVLKVQSNCPGIECLEVYTHLPNLSSNVNVIGHPGAKSKSCMSGKVLHTSRPSISVEIIHKWVEDNTKQYCPHEHCEGKEKKVVCAHNYKWKKFDLRKDFLLIHNCGTSKGASGSPVVNDNGEVIALHSWGMFLGDKQQREKPALEFAHSINFIVEDIKKNNEALARKLNFDKLDTSIKQ